MTEMYNLVMGNVYLYSDGNQSNNCEFWDKSQQEKVERMRFLWNFKRGIMLLLGIFDIYVRNK